MAAEFNPPAGFNFPLPCSDLSIGKNFQTALYCFGILSFWILMMLSALIYHIRATLQFLRWQQQQQQLNEQFANRNNIKDVPLDA